MNDHPDHEHPQSPSRRDFIKLAAASLGGTILTGAGIGCGGSAIIGGAGGIGGPVGVGVIPNGYTFYRVFTPGAGPFLPEVNKLTGGVLNTDTNILFYAQATSNRVGLYQLEVDYVTGQPQITEPSVLFNQGDNLGGGLVIDTIGSAALSNRGQYSICAAVITTDSEHTNDKRYKGLQSLWQNRAGTFDVLVANQDKTPDGSNFVAHMGDVAINSKGDVLFTSDFSHETDKGHFKAQGLFQLYGARSSTSGKLVTSTGDIAAGANGPIAQFGICDFDDLGNYIAQFVSSGDSRTREMGQVSSGILAGNSGTGPRLLYGGAGRAGANVNAILGPRIRNGNYTAVLHTDPTNTQHELHYNGAVVAATGGRSPLGKTINGVGPGSVANDLTHFLVTTDAGMEMVVSNGATQKTILKYGDVLANSPKQIRGIVHGFHSNQSDSVGRIVFIGEFEDGSQSIVVGIPS